ncbi:MAG TPA: DUF1841 family protein [Gammaproteobacteria bacterium]
MFGTDRNALRRYYAESWRKARANEPLEALEQQIAAVIGEHPEYHALFASSEAALEADYAPDSGQGNPFLHLGMHLALREQLATGRPAGLRELWPRLLKKIGDGHAAEHRMMECLGQALWEAQRNNRLPDEAAYLECLRRLV